MSSEDNMSPTIYEFNLASANITKLFNPNAKSVNQKKAEKVLEEIYGNK